MSKLFLRAALIGCATTGVAVAQTQPVPPPIAVPVPTVTFTARVATPAQGKMILKTFDVADLVCPPDGSPLAKPGTDPAMAAATKAFTEVRAEELMKAVKTGTDRTWWDEFGGGGKLAVTTDGKSLVVNHTAAVVDKVGACVETLRKLHHSQVKVEVVLITVPSKHEAVVKLLGDKGHAALSSGELKELLGELQQSTAVNILAQPRLFMLNKQTGCCSIGGTVAVPAAGQTVACAPVGVTTRVTPEVSADLKSVALAFEYEHSEAIRGPMPYVNSCQGKAKMVLADGGSMAVRMCTRKVEVVSEQTVPMLSKVPYVNRLFRNVSVTQEPMDTVAVVTATRVADAVPCQPVASAWTAVVPTMPPTAISTPAPVPVMLPLPAARAVAPPMMPTMPVPAPVALPPAVAPTTAVFPHPVPVMTRTVGPDGLERVGVNFSTLTKADTLPKAVTEVRMTAPQGVTLVRFSPETACVAGACIGTAVGRTYETDDTGRLMAAYKAACLAGNKDEAAKLAVKLLAIDPTCFAK